MTAECRRCRQTWEVDPPLQVTCPTCGAEPETKCRRPSGHPVPGGVHDARDRQALFEVDGYRPCPATPSPVPAPRSDQPELFG